VSRKHFFAAAAVVLAPVIAFAQDQADEPGTGDLEFLVGTWNITALHYDVTNPEDKGRQETGTKVCRHALENGGEPAYITCENISIYKLPEGESHEAYIEYINYNPFVGAFEKANFFSSFPVKVIERVTFDAATRVIEIRGRVEVEHNVDSYVEYWRFNKDFSVFDRKAMINLSSMPMTEYRLILSGKGVRASK